MLMGYGANAGLGFTDPGSYCGYNRHNGGWSICSHDGRAKWLTPDHSGAGYADLQQWHFMPAADGP